MPPYGDNKGMKEMLEERLNPFKKDIIEELRRLEELRKDEAERGQRAGDVNYGLQS